MGKLPSCVFCPVEFFNVTLLFRFPSATSGPCSVSRLESCLAPEPGTGPRVSLILDLGPWPCSPQQPGRPRAASSSLASQAPARGPPGVVTASSHPATGPLRSPRRGTVTSRPAAMSSVLGLHRALGRARPLTSCGAPGPSSPLGLGARAASLCLGPPHSVQRHVHSQLWIWGDSTPLGPMDLDKPTRTLCICNY